MSEDASRKMSGARVLVTGGAGFIGSHLVEGLVADGARVTVVDNFSGGRLENLRDVLARIRLVVGELGDVLRTRRVSVDEYDVVFHLVSDAYVPPSVDNPVLDFETNLVNTLMLLEALRHARNGPRLINVSSAAVYGNPAQLPIREGDPTIPCSPYGVSKLAGECYCAVYHAMYGVRATSMRFFSVYGPRQRKQVVYDLLGKMRANPKQIEVFGDGTQARDFVYVTDVVRATRLAADAAPAEGEVYNVASGTTCSIAELIDAVCRVCGVRPEVRYTGRVRPGDAEKWSVDISALKRLGFEPRTMLETGLKAVRDWHDAENR